MNMNTRALIVTALETLQTHLDASFDYLDSDGTLDGFDPISVLTVLLPSLSDSLSEAVAHAKTADEDAEPESWWQDRDARDELHVLDYED